MDQMKYWAFMSYSHLDAKWANWLHKAVESYRPPKRLVAADYVIHPGVTLEIGCLTRENNATPVAPEGVLIAYGIASVAAVRDRSYVVGCSQARAGDLPLCSS